MQLRQRVGRDTNSLFFLCLFSQLHRKSSTPRADRIPCRREGRVKLFFVIHTVVCIPYEQMFHVRNGDESRKLSKYVRLSDCRSDCQSSWRAFKSHCLLMWRVLLLVNYFQKYTFKVPTSSYFCEI